MIVDNLDHLLDLLPEEPEPDVFWYTELLDRRTNNRARMRMLRSFEHTCQEDLLRQMPIIRSLCNDNGVRAYFRPSARSREAVAWRTSELVLAQIRARDFADVRHAYASACGRTHIRSRQWWIYDVDRDPTGAREAEAEELARALAHAGIPHFRVPSRNGWHVLAKPHDPRIYAPKLVSLHKDNPTNLYIPESGE